MDFGKGRASHIGIVEKVNDNGTYTTIEGNTSLSSNDNGGAVMRRTRGKSVIRGFARPSYDHKFVLVNGKQVNIPSYLVKAGDVIEIKEKNKGLQRMKDIVEVTGGRLVPDWLDVDAEKLQGTVKELPSREQIDVPVDEMLIVELYSK